MLKQNTSTWNTTTSPTPNQYEAFGPPTARGPALEQTQPWPLYLFCRLCDGLVWSVAVTVGPCTRAGLASDEALPSRPSSDSFPFALSILVLSALLVPLAVVS